jgi:hypothetical protein
VLGISDWYTQSNLVFVNSSLKGSYGFTNYIAEAGDTGSNAEMYFFVQASSSDIGFSLFPSESVVAGINSVDPNYAKSYSGMDTNGYMAILSSFGPLNYEYSDKLNLGGSGSAMHNIYASGTGYIANVSSTNITVGGQSVCLANGTNCPTALTGITSLALTGLGNITVANGIASSTLILTGIGGEITDYVNYVASPTGTTNVIGDTIIRGMWFDATTTQSAQWGNIRVSEGCSTTSMPVAITWTAGTGTGDVLWGIQAKAVESAEAPYEVAWSDVIFATSTFTNAWDKTTTSTVAYLAPTSWNNCSDELYFKITRYGAHAQDTFGTSTALTNVSLKYGRKTYSD